MCCSWASKIPSVATLSNNSSVPKGNALMGMAFKMKNKRIEGENIVGGWPNIALLLIIGELIVGLN
jgi:hypothetical protein